MTRWIVSENGTETGYRGWSCGGQVQVRSGRHKRGDVTDSSTSQSSGLHHAQAKQRFVNALRRDEKGHFVPLILLIVVAGSYTCS